MDFMLTNMSPPPPTPQKSSSLVLSQVPDDFNHEKPLMQEHQPHPDVHFRLITAQHVVFLLWQSCLSYRWDEW